MKIFYIYNFFKNSFKSLTSYIFANEISSKYKIVLLDFDSLSKSEKFFPNLTKIKLFELPKKIKFKNKLEVIKIDVLDNKNNSKNDFIEWFNSLKIILNKYEYIIIDSSSSMGYINEMILSLSDKIICPFDLSNNNSSELLNNIILTLDKKKVDMFFIPILTSGNKEINLSLYLKTKKILLDFLVDKWVEIESITSLELLIKNESIISQYRNIINFLLSI